MRRLHLEANGGGADEGISLQPSSSTTRAKIPAYGLSLQVSQRLLSQTKYFSFLINDEHIVQAVTSC